MLTLPHRFGHYQLESLLGQGGMGEVYLAEDTRHGRKVALKLLPEVYGGDEEFLNRFKRESYVAARLRDPHVIPIHDFGEIDNRLYIDMRLVDGRDVRTIIDEDGAIAPERTMHIVGQIAEALDAAHADGLVHRDIKPSNILVTARDFVYVVDFGIARQVGPARTSLTITGTTVGSLDYMAPERFTNDPVDHRTDVYSLACLLYECLTGNRPFRGGDLPSLMYAHLFTEPPRASLSVTVPLALDAVIRRGMAKQAADRHPSAGALAAAARAALAASPAAGPGGVPGVGDPDASTTPRFARPGPARPGPGPGVRHAPGSVSSRHTLPPTDHPPPRRAAASNSGGHAVPPPGAAPFVRVPAAGPAGPARPGPPPGALGGVGTGPLPADPPSDPATAEVGTRPRRWRRVLVATLVAVLVLGGLGVGFGFGFGLFAAPPTVTGTGPAPPPVAVATSIATPTVDRTVAVGATPGYAEVAPDGRFVYICNGDAGTVTVLDTTLNAVIATIEVPAGPPQFVSFSRDSRLAFVSVYNADRTVNLVAFLDVATNKVIQMIPVGRRPFASSISPDGKLLYVPSHDDGRVDVIDVERRALVAQIKVARNPHWVAFSKDGRVAYTANHESNVVSVIDTATRTVRTEIKVGTSPHSTAISPDGSRVAVVNFDSDEVSVIDTASNTVVATVPVGQNPQDLAYAADGRFLYVANSDSNTVSVIDTAANKITATIPSAGKPTSVSVLPDGTRAYVTNLTAGNVLILDTALSR